MSAMHRMFRRLWHRKHFLGNTGGGAALTFALTLVPMVLAAGGAVDFTRYYNSQQNVQTALDAAVLAGAAADNDDTIASNTFSSWKITFNGTVDSPSYSASETDDASYYSGNVDVHLNMEFAALIGISTLDYTVTSKAVRLKTTSGSGGTPCAWIGPGGMKMGGNARFMAPNCQVDIRGGETGFDSGSRMMTPRLCVGPKVTDFRHNGSIFDQDESASFKENCAKPTAYTMPPRPTFGSCDHPAELNYYYENPNAKTAQQNYRGWPNNGGGQSQNNSDKYPSYPTLTLAPGTFCGGVYIHGGPDADHPMRVTLAPGLYKLKGAPFHFDGYVELYGYGVAFYFQDAKSWIRFDGDHITSELTAPTSGDCETDDRCGVLMYEPSALVDAGYSTPTGFGIGASHAWTGNVILPSRWINHGSDACNHDHHMDIYGRMSVYGMRVCGASRWRFWPRKTVMKEACPTPRPQWWPVQTAKKICMPTDSPYGGPGHAGWANHAGGPNYTPAQTCYTQKTFADQWWYSWWHYWRPHILAPDPNKYKCVCPGPEGPSWTYGPIPWEGTDRYNPATWKNGRFANRAGYVHPAQAPWPYHRPCACHSENWHPWHKICEDDDGNYNGDGDGDDGETTYSLPHLVQ